MIQYLACTLPEVEARLGVRGELDLGQPMPRFILEGDWQGLRWPVTGAPEIHSNAGTFAAQGDLQSFTYRLAGQAAGRGAHGCRGRAGGAGGAHDTRIDTLVIHALDGKLGPGEACCRDLYRAQGLYGIRSGLGVAVLSQGWFGPPCAGILPVWCASAGASIWIDASFPSGDVGSDASPVFLGPSPFQDPTPRHPPNHILNVLRPRKGRTLPLPNVQTAKTMKQIGPTHRPQLRTYRHLPTR
ncbi:hypothetical protein [Caldichromatium japonicum]|uniref:hypothetical protein n=1 Tax=Caldichromatium japonicum TaxID=2699430 RepID=UPI001FE9C9EF|nr:hypothetical protein [Caldichromatium japonicum]